MARVLGLTERQRAFVAEYRGRGDGLRAARAAGYEGNDQTVRVTASQLLKHPAVKAAVSEKIEKNRRARTAAAKRSGRPAIGSLSRRLEILMAIAEDTGEAARDRIKAVEVAAELAGEKGRGRFDAPPPAPVADEPEAPERAKAPPVRLSPHLVVARGTDG
jgi:hypothetical protein